MFEKLVVIDGRDHLLGRLASVVAKELLSGQHIVVVRAEELVISGHFFRKKARYLDFLNKRNNVNPKRGPFHLRAPSKIFWRTVRGMLPHKMPRGAAALGRLRVFEGVPPPFDKKKRVVVPAALRVLKLAQNRKVTRLGRLSSDVGWQHADVVARLEEKRKARSTDFYKKKLKLKAITDKAKADNTTDLLKEYGY